jgi:hypothetical protein
LGWLTAREPRLNQGQHLRQRTLGPIPESLALQLLSSLPSAQLAKPSHTESGSRQRSWSQRNSLWAQPPGDGHLESETPRVSSPFGCAGSGWRGGKYTGSWEVTHLAQGSQPGTRPGNQSLPHCCQRRRPHGGGWCWC